MYLRSEEGRRTVLVLGRAYRIVVAIISVLGLSVVVGGQSFKANHVVPPEIGQGRPVLQPSVSQSRVHHFSGLGNAKRALAANPPLTIEMNLQKDVSSPTPIRPHKFSGLNILREGQIPTQFEPLLNFPNLDRKRLFSSETTKQRF
jgi:hypothetical protein